LFIIIDVDSVFDLFDFDGLTTGTWDVQIWSPWKQMEMSPRTFRSRLPSGQKIGTGESGNWGCMNLYREMEGRLPKAWCGLLKL